MHRNYHTHYFCHHNTAQIILMEPSTVKAASPERSRSIKLKVSNRIFPQDFFHRSSSQSPTKAHNHLRYLQSSPDKRANLEPVVKSELYWDSMREQLEQCRDLSKRDRVKQIQRIWVYSQKKNRVKPEKEQKPRFESRQEARKDGRENCQLVESPLKNSIELKEGLFTFFGKCPNKGFNLVLPPIK